MEKLCFLSFVELGMTGIPDAGTSMLSELYPSAYLLAEVITISLFSVAFTVLLEFLN